MRSEHGINGANSSSICLRLGPGVEFLNLDVLDEARLPPDNISRMQFEPRNSAWAFLSLINGLSFR